MNWHFFSVMITLAATITGPFVVIMLAKAYARRLEGGVPGAALQADLEELQARVEDADRLEARVAELEERLEFTERLLARQRDHERIAGGADAV